MLTHLRLENFKAWHDTGQVVLKPLTLLLGTNSSGKSSLTQALLLLKQTVQSPDRTIHLNLGGDEANDLFNFGGFEDVLSKDGQGERTFTIDFTCRPPGHERLAEVAFHATYGRNSAGGVVIQEWQLAADKARFRVKRQGRGAYALFVDDETQPRGTGRQMAPERSVALGAEAISTLGAAGEYLEDMSLALRRALEGIVYLGPLRLKPERDYVWNRAKPGEVGAHGQRAVDALLASTLMRGEEQGALIAGVSHWLGRMGIAQRLELKQMGRSSRYEVMVHQDGIAANLRDVGIGISQVLPVLTVAHFAPAGSTVLLEEPEIHLHPRAQAVLAELFVEVGQERGLQFIVETHSEHLFRRMQTLMARQTITPQDAVMYFVERADSLARLRTLELDPYGRVRNWPPGFFGDALGETREQAALAIQRAKEQRAGNGTVSD